MFVGKTVRRIAFRSSLLRQNGIGVIRSRKFKCATDSHHAFDIAPNLLQRDDMASRSSQKWADDVTCVGTREGWLYLAVIIDLLSRLVIGWAIRALNMAAALVRAPPDCLHHTDRGLRYCAHDDRKILRRHGFKRIDEP